METESFQMSPITQCTSSDENDQSICGLVRGANPGTPSIHAWPRVLDSLSQLSKFKDYDFHNFTRNVTEGKELPFGLFICQKEIKDLTISIKMVLIASSRFLILILAKGY